MTKEIRFEVSKEILERHEKLIQLLGRKTGELGRALYLSGLEKMEKALLEGKFPVFIPIKNKNLLRFKFEKEEDFNNS